MMIKYNFIKTLTAGFALATALYPQAWAINQEIDCPSDSPAGSHCWQCGSNCYATLTGTTLNITGSGALDNPGAAYSSTVGGELTNSTWKNYNIETVNVGKNITSIGQDAFIRMRSIKAVNFEEGSRLNSVGQAAFGDGPIKFVVLPSGVGSLGTSAFSGSQNIYCTASQMNGVCKDLNYAKQYERQGDKIIINDGDETSIYNLDFTKQYDANGNVITKYDADGNLLAQYGYAADGSVYTYDPSGKLIGAKKTSPFTPAEAAALIKKGNNNIIKMTFK